MNLQPSTIRVVLTFLLVLTGWHPALCRGTQELPDNIEVNWWGNLKSDPAALATTLKDHDIALSYLIATFREATPFTDPNTVKYWQEIGGPRVSDEIESGCLTSSTLRLLHMVLRHPRLIGTTRVLYHHAMASLGIPYPPSEIPHVSKELEWMYYAGLLRNGFEVDADAFTKSFVSLLDDVHKAMEYTRVERGYRLSHLSYVSRVLSQDQFKACLSAELNMELRMRETRTKVLPSLGPRGDVTFRRESLARLLTERRGDTVSAIWGALETFVTNACDFIAVDPPQYHMEIINRHTNAQLLADWLSIFAAGSPAERERVRRVAKELASTLEAKRESITKAPTLPPHLHEWLLRELSDLHAVAQWYAEPRAPEATPPPGK